MRFATAGRIGMMVVAGVVVLGCHKKVPPPTPVPVSFQVVFSSGKPVTNVMLTLHPDGEPGIERPSPQLLDQDGRCTIGCPPGRYKATLAPLPTQHGSAADAGQLSSPGTGPDKKSPIPQSYTSMRESPLSVTITEASKEEKFIVEGSPKK